MVNFAIECAQEAGRFLLTKFGQVDSIEKKGDRNLVTDIDRKAQDIIVKKIKEKYPQHGILGEEGERFNLESRYLWIIDPLDGTHNFIRNIDIFGVSIGLLHQEEFIIGVIYIPSTQELYVGEKNNGAYKNGRRIYVSPKDSLKECSASFDSSIRYAPGIMLKTLEILAKEVFNIRMFGSSARALSYMAEGKLDVIIEFNDRSWDFAGGVCIIEEAGGVFTDLKGKLPTYKTIGYISANKIIYEKIKQILSPTLPLL